MAVRCRLRAIINCGNDDPNLEVLPLPDLVPGRLSLVSCPIALYPASSLSEKVSFNRINRKTRKPVEAAERRRRKRRYGAARGHLLGSRHRNYSDKFASSALGVYFAVIRNSIAFILSPNRSFIPTLTRAYRNGRPMQMYDPLEGLPKPSAQALS